MISYAAQAVDEGTTVKASGFLRANGNSFALVWPGAILYAERHTHRARKNKKTSENMFASRLTVDVRLDNLSLLPSHLRRKHYDEQMLCSVLGTWTHETIVATELDTVDYLPEDEQSAVPRSNQSAIASAIEEYRALPEVVATNIVPGPTDNLLVVAVDDLLKFSSRVSTLPDFVRVVQSPASRAAMETGKAQIMADAKGKRWSLLYLGEGTSRDNIPLIVLKPSWMTRPLGALLDSLEPVRFDVQPWVRKVVEPAIAAMEAR